MNTEAQGRAVFLDRDGVLVRAMVRDGKPFRLRPSRSSKFCPARRER